MSWEAVTWATKQRMKLPQEQLMLFVLSNCADPDGVAFATWPGRDHWWRYLADLTRLSKSSLFRHLKTIEEKGLCHRSTLVLSDGTQRPIVHLDLSVKYIYEEDESESHHETESTYTEIGSENDSESNDVEDDSEGTSPQSHHETKESASPTGGTNPVPLVGPHKDSTKDSKSSPPSPPPGGLAVRDELWEEFVRSWREPMPKMALARSTWDHVPTEKRGEAVAAAKGYFAWLAKHPKPPATISAQSFLRDIAGFAQWLRYTPDGEGGRTAIGLYALDSREAKALAVLYDVALSSAFFASVKRKAVGVYHADPITPQLLALANAGPRENWPRLTYQQAAAWEGFLRGHLTVAHRPLRDGDHAPWSWPPRKDGAVATGPPGTLMTPEDEEFLTNQNKAG
jgi:hypothetical protein